MGLVTSKIIIYLSALFHHVTSVIKHKIAYFSNHGLSTLLAKFAATHRDSPPNIKMLLC